MSKREIAFGSGFKRDLKKQFAQLASAEWAEVLNCLVQDAPLPEKYRDHPLTGDFKDYRECHVKPDLLLVYAKRGNALHLARLASHAELFG
ncbi:addiction module antitoxin [Neisseria bacilliformis ATCC BAA-1200]|uniref:Addiction module antitoxin n=1 Tax=Neisseria bacilliformis ATCC BAA-1200 TaxID=888742 RepID=F2BBP7_9NEIS|nr:type II toxin-antitoxin system YafQ family toxin [Neisseria bacilliformis]EGF11193.1 addiction module antitoxin [Neisseria bacilliformis ATCC BAA-1200]QMT48230.1 type II toxin-antitoxin system YafQ family toxin [Neisseria bacilliformis]DAX56473.1 MAG TPA: bacterial toxin [Caudoviricetes sp.]